MVGYLQLAHNRRVAGSTQAEVLLNLGREDSLDVEGLRRLARSIARYTEGQDPLGTVEESAGEGLRVKARLPGRRETRRPPSWFSGVLDRPERQHGS